MSFISYLDIVIFPKNHTITMKNIKGTIEIEIARRAITL